MARYAVLDPDPAAVAIDEDLHQVETKALAHAALLLLVTVKNLLLPGIRDATAGIRNRHPDKTVSPVLCPDDDLDTGAPVLCRVADQIREDLAEEIVGQDLPGNSLVQEGKIREVGGLLPDDRIEVDRPDMGGPA